MQYEVQIVEGNNLPNGTDLVIIERGAGLPPVMLLAGRPATAFRAMRDYEASVECAGEPSLLYAV